MRGWKKSVLLVVALWSLAGQASALTVEGNCDGWSSTGHWGWYAYYENTAILQRFDGNDFIDVEVATDSDLTAGGTFLMGSLWQSAGPEGLTAGTYRVFLEQVLYSGIMSEPTEEDLQSHPQTHVFEGTSVSEAFECFAPVAHASTRTPGYWKNHASAWPQQSLSVGGQGYDQSCLLAVLDSPVKGDARIILLHHLISAKLNLANGANPYAVTDVPLPGANVSSTIAAADDYLAQRASGIDCDDGSLLGTKPTGDAKQSGLALKDALDAFNNGN